MRILVFSDVFVALAKKLDAKTKSYLNAKLQDLQRDPFFPTLHTKPLAGSLKGFFSFRVGRDVRVIFIIRDAATIQLIKIASRDKAYRL